MTDDVPERQKIAAQIITTAIQLRGKATTMELGAVAAAHLEGNGFLVEPMDLTILQRRLAEARSFASAMRDETTTPVPWRRWDHLLAILGES